MWSYPLPYLLNWILGIENEPAPGSRWLALDDAVGSFCDILQSANAPPRVAVVTWASTIGTNTTEFQLTGQTSPAVTLDLNLTTNLDSVYNAVHNRSLNVMLGGTDMASGINSGISVLTSNNARPYAKKIMVLMTDGQWNTDDDPVNAAAVAAANNITIHCVCFLKNSDQVTTQQIAAMTGGQFYYASDSASLTAAFQKLAYSLPVVLTK